MTPLKMTRPGPSMASRALICVILWSTFCGEACSKDPPKEQGTREELAEIRNGDVLQLLQVISERDKWFSVRTGSKRAHYPYSRVAGWKIAKGLLRKKLDEARPKLVEFLGSPERNTRLNALDVLAHDELDHRIQLKKRILKLLDDDFYPVREKAVVFLGGINDAEIESVLVGRLKNLPHTDHKEVSLAVKYVSALTENPLSEDRVVPAVLHVLDQATETLLLCTTVQKAKRFRSSEKYGLELNKRYWRILSTTKDTSLPYIVTGAMDENDPQTLQLLLKARTIKNDEARRYAAGSLVRHSLFDPIKRDELLKQLLNDKYAFVRRGVLSSLSHRRDLSGKYRISKILAGYDQELVIELKPQIYACIFNVLDYLPQERRFQLLRDEEGNLGKRIARDLKDESLQRVIVFHSQKVMGKDYPKADLNPEQLLREVKEWWRQF